MCAKDELPEAVVACNVAVLLVSVASFEILDAGSPAVVLCGASFDVDTLAFAIDIVAVTSFVDPDKLGLVV